MKAPILLGGIVAWCCFQLRAAERIYRTAAAPAEINHWPGLDNLIGTADDVVAAHPIGMASAPNLPGSYSYIAVRLGALPPKGLLPELTDSATFVDGTVTIDPGITVTNGIPTLKALEFGGTDLFPGHGAYRVHFSNAYYSSYTHDAQHNRFGYGVHTFFDFTATFVAGPATGKNSEVTGTIYWLDARNFATTVINDLNPADPLVAYVNSVVRPLALQRGATSLLCGHLNLRTPGSSPGTSGGFPALQGVCAFVALEFDNPSAFAITSFQPAPTGLKLTWSPLTGRKYTIEAANALSGGFTPLATHVVPSEYIDSKAASVSPRFYRVRAE